MSNRTGILRETARQQGVTVEELVTRAVREEGTAYAAAQKLQVAPNAIRYWLKKLGYEPRFSKAVTWEKAEDGEAVAE